MISSLIFCVKTWALNPNFYISLYEQMDLAEDLSVSNQDLNKTITRLLDYLENKESSISFKMTIDGQKQEVFDAKEKRHMVDVKNLYQNTKNVGIVLFISGLILFLFIARSKNGLAFLSKGIIRASICFLIFLAFLGMWIATDFTDFWTHFHQLFFSNQDWLLTPGVDFMIDMLPESVFERLVLSIVGTYAAFLLVLNVLCLCYQRKKAPIAFEVDS